MKIQVRTTLGREAAQRIAEFEAEREVVISIVLVCTRDEDARIYIFRADGKVGETIVVDTDDYRN